MRETLRGQSIAIGILCAAAVLLGLLGPFGTYGFGEPIERIVLWLALILPGYLFYMPAIVGSRIVAGKLDLPALPVLLLALTFASIPMTLVVSFVLGAVGGPSDPVARFPQVLLLGLLVGLLFWARGRDAGSRFDPRPAKIDPSEEASAGARRPRLLDRLPAGHDGRLLALQSEDHYVRVHGDGRSDLVLMRMEDAIAQMEPVEGVRIHRGWWIAREAMIGIDLDGRAMTLRAKGGIEAPVSRPNQKAIRKLLG